MPMSMKLATATATGINNKLAYQKALIVCYSHIQ